MYVCTYVRTYIRVCVCVVSDSLQIQCQNVMLHGLEHALSLPMFVFDSFASRLFSYRIETSWDLFLKIQTEKVFLHN